MLFSQKHSRVRQHVASPALPEEMASNLQRSVSAGAPGVTRCGAVVGSGDIWRAALRSVFDIATCYQVQSQDPLATCAVSSTKMPVIFVVFQPRSTVSSEMLAVREAPGPQV